MGIKKQVLLEHRPAWSKYTRTCKRAINLLLFDTLDD